MRTLKLQFSNAVLPTLESFVEHMKTARPEI